MPAFVLIPAGTNAVPFTATVFDDTLINATRRVQLTAQVRNWTNGVAAIDLLDNENHDLIVLLPASAPESAGVLEGAGRVRLAGTFTTNLTVTLIPSRPTELTVAATAVIFAGQTNAVFDLIVVDDDELDGDQAAAITARAPGLNDGSATMLILEIGRAHV